MNYRDVIDIQVEGGRGGDGGMSFLRLKYISKGGPDGGHGGNGGHVILKAIDDVGALARLAPRKTYKGGTGMQGEGRNKHGKRGRSLTLEVPVGTTARDRDTGEVIADLTEVGQTATVAQGGRGGRGNASFATATRRAPRFAEYGTKGERHALRLELKTVADVGLVGFPNAGKSSLLAALSNARPVVADYPFTTLTPNLGVVNEQPGYRRLTLADVPGLIEGASEGKGLGHEFLRHISRTRLLAWVLDIAGQPADELRALQHEVRSYDPTLLELPSLIVLHKTDLAAPDEITSAAAELAAFGLPVFPASSLEQDGLADLRDALFDLLPERPHVEPEATTDVVTADPMRIERLQDGSGFRVAGRDAEDIIERFDVTNREALAYLQQRFERQGLHAMLRNAGAKNGDDVWIGDAAFEWWDERTPAPQDAADPSGEEDLDGEEGLGHEDATGGDVTQNPGGASVAEEHP